MHGLVPAILQSFCCGLGVAYSTLQYPFIWSHFGYLWIDVCQTQEILEILDVALKLLSCAPKNYIYSGALLCKDITETRTPPLIRTLCMVPAT